MSMNDYSNQEPQNKEPLSSKITRYVGVGSSLLIIGGLAYWAYGLGSRDASNVPVIQGLEGDIRTAPENAGGEEVDYQGNQVNGVLEGNPPALADNVDLAPTPTDLAGVDPATPDANATVVEIPVETPIATETEIDETVVAMNDDIQPVNAPDRRPELLYIPPKDQLNPASLEARPVGSEGGEVAPVPVASASEIVEALPEISTPSAEPTVEEVAAIIEQEIVEEEPAPTPEAVVQTAASTEEDLGPRLASGTPLIQLAANTKLVDTQNQWKKIQSANSELLGSKSLYVEKTTVNGKLYYRLRVSGFADGADAQAACVALLARNVQCLYVRAK